MTKGEKLIFGMKKTQDRLLELIFPPRCPSCDRVTKTAGKVCEECVGKLCYVKEAHCMRCGKPMIGDEDGEFCEDCKKHKHLFTRGRSLYEYASIRDSVYRFKYSGRKEYADFYSREIALHLGREIRSWECDGIIPVPMYRGKERVRGYNQARWLADALGEELGIKVYPDMVERIVNTRPMKELNAAQRQINLKNAFIVRRYDVKLCRALIVDDIYTTGSTIDHVAAALMAAGVKEVCFVTLATGTGV